MNRFTFSINKDLPLDKAFWESLECYQRGSRQEVVRRYLVIAHLDLREESISAVIARYPYSPGSVETKLETRSFPKIPAGDPLREVTNNALLVKYQKRALYLRALVLHGHGLVTGSVQRSGTYRKLTPKAEPVAVKATVEPLSAPVEIIETPAPKESKPSVKAAFGGLMGKKK